MLGFDTEFVRCGTYFPKPCLMQLSTPQSEYLIDLQANLDLSSLGPVFSNPHIACVVHACGEDLEILHGAGLPLPAGLFDTQVAASLCGLGFGPGLQQLCQDLLGVEVDKTTSRSDWSRRPLSDEQLTYAAEDVRLLHPLHDILHKRLVSLGRWTWFQEDMQSTRARYEKSPDPWQAYLRLRGGWKLSPRQQEVLRHLARRRVLTMVEKDLPRKKVAADEDLVLLAQHSPVSTTALAKLRKMLSAPVMAQSKLWLETIRKALEADIPDGMTLIEAPLEKASRPQVQMVKAVVEAVAEELDISAPVLANRSQIEDTVRWLWLNGQEPDCCRGWRGEQLRSRLQGLIE